MIDEKIVIKDIENRIDTFVKQYPKEKDCRSVQVQREFIHILELAAKKQKAKEHERMLSIESELLGTLNDMKDSKEDFCDKQGGKCELYESCFKCAVAGIVEICLLLLRGVGISEEKACADTQDMLIFKACELYCKWQFNFDNQAERFEKAFEGLRDFLSLGGEYTNGSTE